MNYRHAYHAGNFADCMKHALLIALLGALRRKPAPFAVLDTHAGIGAYDLAGAQASRTNEAREGILRVLDADPPALADYAALVRALGLYPGSPAIIRALLRPGDLLIACELHDEDGALLKRRFARDRQVQVHHRDGYEAIRALLPPRAPAGLLRRGLVLIDPPFEREDEFARIAAALPIARHKLPGGILAAWYPIKHRAPVREFHEALRAGPLRDVIAAEFFLREPTDPARLNGCGLLIVAPPFGIEASCAAILAALVDLLGEAGAGYQLTRVIDE
jgi:23S rRNA (adenine2030-N6)-methyltransferase